MAREHERNYDLDKDKIDLVNIGTWKDQLSFGMRNRHQVKTGKNYVPPILTVKDNPSKVVQNFVDQIGRCQYRREQGRVNSTTICLHAWSRGYSKTLTCD